MKVLSLAWKYHPSITSGVGVACEGLNNALSSLVDLTVIYPKVTSVRTEEEIILSSDDLTEEQFEQIREEYVELVEEGSIELPLRLDPYFVSSQSSKGGRSISKTEFAEKRKGSVPTQIKIKKYGERLLYDEVDVFGESVKDKIYLYNRLVEELAPNIHFDVIHAHDWMTFLAGIALKDRYQKPLILHVHSLEYDRVGHKDASWVYDVERFAMSKADQVIAPSNYTKGIIESNYGLGSSKIVKIHNAVSLPDGVEPANQWPNSKPFRVLFAGRIDGNKGIEYFIDVARNLLKKTDEVSFVVVGRGKGDIIFSEIEGFDELKSKFAYLGAVGRDELFKLYQSCHVLCMPSISEPFGLTAIEAASMRMPVVLSKRTGASEILKRTPSAEFWDIDKFTSHIHSILYNQRTRDRVIQSNSKSVANLSWESTAKQVFDVYRCFTGHG